MLATKWQPLRIPHGFGFSRISYLSDAENVAQAREKHANGKACQRKTMLMTMLMTYACRWVRDGSFESVPWWFLLICFAAIAGSVVRVSFRSILFFLKCPFLIVSDLLRNNVLYNLMSCSTHSDPRPVNASQTKVKFRGRIGYITLSLYIMVYENVVMQIQDWHCFAEAVSYR